MVLPSGFALPPLPYLVGLLAADAAVAGLLVRERPAVREATVLALVPWMLAGAALHALDRIGAAPPGIAPLLSTPSVYLSVFAVAGAAWLAADRGLGEASDRALGAAGTAAFALALLAVVAAAPALHPVWSAVGLVVSAAIAAVAWIGLRRYAPGAARATGRVGALAVFGHALDGVSTAIGVDVLGFGERTPASRAIMDAAAALPTVDLLGVGWLFVVVKVAVALVVVVAFEEYVRDEPAQGRLVLAAVAAVGLGPGAFNLLLYSVAAVG